LALDFARTKFSASSLGKRVYQSIPSGEVIPRYAELARRAGRQMTCARRRQRCGSQPAWPSAGALAIGALFAQQCDLGGYNAVLLSKKRCWPMKQTLSDR